MLLAKFEQLATTAKIAFGELVLIPTLPLAKIVNNCWLVELATTNIGVVVLPPELVPWTTNIALGVVEAMPMRRLALTLRIEVPEEEATLKGSRVVVPWTLKETVAEVALTPETVPLLIRDSPEDRAVAEVQ